MERLLVLCLVAGLQVVTSQSPAPGSCIHFSSLRQAANCLPFANCSGAQCNITYPEGRASFLVHKCQDPVTVDLSVVTGNSVFHRQFNHSESVSDMFITMSRNATHLHFEVTALVEGDIMTILIPTVTVHLNPRACMCQSLQSVARDTHLPQIIPIQFSCTRNTTCNGVHCQVSHSNTLEYTSDIVVDPCSEGLEVTVRNSQGQVTYHRVFQDTQRVPFSGSGYNATLHVHIVHHNYSMEVEVYLEVMIFGKVELLSPHTIILDRSHCTNPPMWGPSQPPSTTPRTTPHTAPTTNTIGNSQPTNRQGLTPTTNTIGNSQPTNHQGLTPTTNTIGNSQPTNHQGLTPTTNTIGNSQPTNRQGLSSELLAVAVATPVGIALCLLVLVLVVIAVVLVWRQQHRRRGQYEYNQMKFSEVNED